MVTHTPHKNGHAPVTIQRPPEKNGGDVDWSLLSAQGRVLFYIALCPVCSVQEIAIALGLTERAVWGIIRELRRKDMLVMQRENRRHRYSVNLDAELLHPTIQGLTLRPVLGELAERGERDPDEACVRIP
jgi:biotin operon repressor